MTFDPKKRAYGNAVPRLTDDLRIPMDVADLLIKDAKKYVPWDYWHYVYFGTFVRDGERGYHWIYEPSSEMDLTPIIPWEDQCQNHE